MVEGGGWRVEGGCRGQGVGVRAEGGGWRGYVSQPVGGVKGGGAASACRGSHPEYSRADG